jgi:hypothetical protein
VKLPPLANAIAGTPIKVTALMVVAMIEALTAY